MKLEHAVGLTLSAEEEEKKIHIKCYLNVHLLHIRTMYVTETLIQIVLVYTHRVIHLNDR